MFQPRPVPATPFVERLRSGAGRRTLGLGLAIAIEILVLLLLLTLGREKLPGVQEDRPTVVTFIAAGLVIARWFVPKDRPVAATPAEADAPIDG